MQFTRRSLLQFGAVVATGLLLTTCGRGGGEAPVSGAEEAAEAKTANKELGTLAKGSRTGRGFEVDDLLRDTPAGDVHFSLHVPGSYDGSEPYALYVHCPGWEGLWFQGVGACSTCPRSGTAIPTCS